MPYESDDQPISRHALEMIIQRFEMQIRHEQELREQYQSMNERMVEIAKEFVQDRMGDMERMRDQVSLERGSVETRLRVLENFSSNLQGRVAMVGGIIAAILLGVQLVIHLWR